MCWRIGADQWRDGGTGNVVAELPWRVQICCANAAGRRLLAWAHHSLHRVRFYCVRRALRYCKLCKTRQNPTHRATRACSHSVSEFRWYYSVLSFWLHCLLQVCLSGRFRVALCPWDRCAAATRRRSSSTHWRACNSHSVVLVLPWFT